MEQEKIIKILMKYKEDTKNKYHINSLGIFGSAVNNSMNEQSDIDVVVSLKKQDLFELIGIKQDLEEIFNCPIDIVSYREKMNAFLRNRIDNEAVYV